LPMVGAAGAADEVIGFICGPCWAW
jgi:hypothetical protein